VGNAKFGLGSPKGVQGKEGALSSFFLSLNSSHMEGTPRMKNNMC
jgi:hypothetical protein